MATPDPSRQLTDSQRDRFAELMHRQLSETETAYCIALVAAGELDDDQAVDVAFSAKCLHVATDAIYQSMTKDMTLEQAIAEAKRRIDYYVARWEVSQRQSQGAKTQ